MTQSKWIVRLAALVAVTGACSSEEAAKSDKMIVQGTVSAPLLSNDVEAVALGADGRTFWSALDAKGDFKLTVPSGQSYRIVLAKRGTDGKTAAVAQLALTNATGKTQWVTAKAGAVLRLGDLVPAGTLATAPATGGLKPATSGSGRGGADMSEADDGSGRGGSGRGGRGGEDGEHDDDSDAFEDDASHSDDPECHEVEHDEGNVCAASSPEMESTRNAAEDVSESADFATPPADESCAPAPAAPSEPAPSTSSSSGSVPADTASEPVSVIE